MYDACDVDSVQMRVFHGGSDDGDASQRAW
jgi:hypothetical protein